MIHIYKNFNSLVARNHLESANYRLDVQNSVNNRKGQYNSSRYGHEVVRTELQQIYHDKCCYCESKIPPVATPQIEHFRPKAKITGVNDNGYYWLGYEWSNLLMVCPACNGIKSSKFPLHINNRIVNHPTTNGGNLDYTLFSLTSGYLKNERPLIINPEVLYPEKLMYIDYFCKLNPIKGNRYAVTTIRELKLNRDALIAARQKIVDDVIIRIEEQIVIKFEENTTNNQFKRQLNIIFKDIVKRMSPTEEYTLLGINMVMSFDELILEDIDPYFHDTIMDYFIEFLDNID